MSEQVNEVGTIKKAWGQENVLFSTPDYCLKELQFDKAGNHFSFHFHRHKHESWVVVRGRFVLTWIDLETADVHNRELGTGERWVNPQLLPHKLTASEDDSVILEVSTGDFPSDNHRIAKGMSQL